MDTVLRLENVSKKFGATQALSNVDFTLKKGELHALVGENGAGKSTLIKILSGVYKPDSGEITMNNQLISIDSPNSAQLLGISTLFQEIQEIPLLSVAENIYIGREHTRKGFIDWRNTYRSAMEVFREWGVDISVEKQMGSLSVSARKMVEIIRAITYDASIILMDEPTANLNEDEMGILFKIIEQLKSKGISIIYISHRLREVFKLADRVSVLRDGSLVETLDCSMCDENHLVGLMIGREIGDMYPRFPDRPGSEVLSVHELSYKNKIKNVNFKINKQEVIGLAGLDGSGAKTLTKILFGMIQPTKGTILYKNRPEIFESPRDSMNKGISFVPEDRKLQGLFLSQSIQMNISISSLSRVLSKFGIVKNKKVIVETNKLVGKLSIKTKNIQTNVKSLSGGNQQKVLLAKWMIEKYDIMILEEPTRGVDVGAKVDIYSQIKTLVTEGMTAIIYSSELPELIGLCDRIFVFAGGELTATIERNDATEENIIQHAILR